MRASPINATNLNDPYFFIASKTIFPNIDADPSSFKSKFLLHADGQVTAVFPNLGKDCILIVPYPRGHYQGFLHLKQYIQKSDLISRDDFWKNIGAVSKQLLSDGKTIYLKTHGHGVHYVHFRIQINNKYYVTAELATIDSSRQFYQKYFNSGKSYI
jgi:hypothetical protein